MRELQGTIQGILGNPQSSKCWWKVIDSHGVLTLCGKPDFDPDWANGLKIGDQVHFRRTERSYTRPDEFVGGLVAPFNETPKRSVKPLADRRPRGLQDDALVGLLELTARDRGVKVCELVNELLWQAVQEGKLR